MVDRKTALGHDLLQVAIGERVSQIPANAEQDDRVFEVPPAEQCWPFSDHRYTLPNPLSSFATQPEKLLKDGIAAAYVAIPFYRKERPAGLGGLDGSLVQ